MFVGGTEIKVWSMECLILRIKRTRGGLRITVKKSQGFFQIVCSALLLPPLNAVRSPPLLRHVAARTATFTKSLTCYGLFPFLFHNGLASLLILAGIKQAT